MALESLRLALRYSTIKVGFLLLFATLLLSILSMHSVNHTYSEEGEVEPGNYTLGNEKFESEYFSYNRTLTLWGNGEVRINDFNYSVFGGITVEPVDRPRLEVVSGSFRYAYSVVAKDYPFIYISLAAIVTFLIGLILSVLGYIQMMRELRGGEKDENH